MLCIFQIRFSVVVGVSDIFADVSVPVMNISVVFGEGPVPAVDNRVVGCSMAVVFDSVEEGSAVVYGSDDDGSVAVISISIVFEDSSDSAVDNSFGDDSVGFEVDPVDDGSVEDVSVSALDFQLYLMMVQFQLLKTQQLMSYRQWKLRVQLLCIFQIMMFQLML